MDCVRRTSRIKMMRNTPSGLTVTSVHTDVDKKESQKGTIQSRDRSQSRIRTKIRSMFSQMKLPKSESEYVHLFIILGSSVELAKQQTYPTLWNLYKAGLLPSCIRFYGFARYATTSEELRDKCRKYSKVGPEEEEVYEKFWALHNFYVGSYTSKTDFEMFQKELSAFATVNYYSHRLFYIALPNSTLEYVMPFLKMISHSAGPSPSKCWTRVIIEKPFGRDLESNEKLTDCLLSVFKEEELYRVDHYLAKEMIQSLMTVRFGNLLFSSTWNRDCIKAILITLNDPCGVVSNTKYFDNYGIIRDVMQNHLLQILSLVAMEKPVSTRPNDIRDEKVKVLRCIPPAKIDEVVLGQYVGNPKACGGDPRKNSYSDEPDIPKNSITPTFCTAVLRVMNDRWDGVPFILRCGKAMNEKLAEVRVQYKDVPADIFEGKPRRNELIIQVEPTEKVYMKTMTTIPGDLFGMEEAQLTLGNFKHDKNSYDVLERLTLDVFHGSQLHFVRSDELSQTWRIFTPLLRKIEKDKIQPKLYLSGSNGPKEANELIRQNNFIIYE